MIRLHRTILTDGSAVWGVLLPEGAILDCITEQGAHELANHIERLTNLQYDGWSPVEVQA